MSACYGWLIRESSGVRLPAVLESCSEGEIIGDRRRISRLPSLPRFSPKLPTHRMTLIDGSWDFLSFIQSFLHAPELSLIQLLIRNS
jgi:hypothetical protein